MTLPAPPPRYENVPVANAPMQYPPSQSLPRQASQSSTSPWAQGAPPSAQRPVQAAAQGPMVIEREQTMRAAVGQPLVLGGQAPLTHSFGTPLPLAERVRQSLGASARVPQPMPTAQPSYQNPYGLVPPGRIPNASLGADPTVTGSITPEKRPVPKAKAGRVEANLMSPQSVAEQTPPEPASVFNLPPLQQRAQ
jgi:hypothetical protein